MSTYPSIRICIMVTDPRTGMRSIRPARETLAAVALTGLTFGTVLRGLYGQPGGVAGAIVALVAVAMLSRYKVSWDQQGVSYRTPFSCRRRRWVECSAYSLEPQQRDRSAMAAAGGSPLPRWFQPCRLRIHRSRSASLSINLKPYSWQDIRHLTDRVGHEVRLREGAAVAVS
jgi:hypothetical protein